MIDRDEEILAMVLEPTSMEQGFKLLMDSYQEKLYWQIRRMVHDHDDAKDILQNTLIKVYRYLGNFEQKSSLYTWIYRIGTNEAISFLNKKHKRRSSSIEDISLANSLKADPYFDGDQAQIMLAVAISTLPPKQKAVFNLRFYDEMSYKDMSKVLETSEGALKASYHHAAKKVEAYLINND